MKVYDIIKLTEDLDIRSVNGGYEIFDTETGNRARNTIIYPDEGSAEEVRDRLRAQRLTADPSRRSAADRGSSERGRSTTRREPPLTRDSSRPSLTADPEQRNPALRPDVRPGTPTSDSLSAGERRRLARTGSISRRGVTYSRSQIAAADAEAERMRRSTAGRDIRPGDDRAASNSRNPSTPDADAPRGAVARAKAFGLGIVRRALPALRAGTGVGVGAFLNAAITAATLEDQLDSFLRIFEEELNELQAAGNERPRWGDMTRTQAAYDQAISDLVETAYKGVFAGGAGVIVAAFAFILGTGPAGWLAALVGGGLLGYYGSEGTYELLDRWGVTETIENWIKENWLSPINLMGWAEEIDTIQNVPLVPGDDPMTVPGTESIQEEDDEESTDLEAAKSEIARRMRQSIESSEELKQMYRDGREEALSAVRSSQQR